MRVARVSSPHSARAVGLPAALLGAPGAEPVLDLCVGAEEVVTADEQIAAWMKRGKSLGTDDFQAQLGTVLYELSRQIKRLEEHMRSLKDPGRIDKRIE